MEVALLWVGRPRFAAPLGRIMWNSGELKEKQRPVDVGTGAQCVKVTQAGERKKPKEVEESQSLLTTCFFNRYFVTNHSLARDLLKYPVVGVVKIGWLVW
jgi:hypothetical protein